MMFRTTGVSNPDHILTPTRGI